MARRKSDWDKSCDSAMHPHDCKTERGEGRWITTGDGRETIKDRSDEDC